MMNKEEDLAMTHPFTPHLFNSLGLTESSPGFLQDRTNHRPAFSRRSREAVVCAKRSRCPVYSMPTSALIY